jgi:energy-coupling factor transporter ATP-binding protein EcfA2
MIDQYTEGKTATIKTPAQLEAESEGLIRLQDATFTWGSKSGSATPGFNLYIPDVTFVKGKINLITGPTGSGKSSLLKVTMAAIDVHNSG